MRRPERTFPHSSRSHFPTVTRGKVGTWESGKGGRGRLLCGSDARGKPAHDKLRILLDERFNDIPPAMGTRSPRLTRFAKVAEADC